MNVRKLIVERWHRLRANTRAAHVIGRIETLVSRNFNSPSRVLKVAHAQSLRGDNVLAIETLTFGIARFPDSVDLQYREAFMLEKHGKLLEAKEQYLRLTDNPSAADQVPYRLAVTLKRLGEIDEALSWALNFTSTFPQDTRASMLAFELAANQPLWRRFEILANAQGELETDLEWQTNLIAVAFKLKRFEVCVSRYEAAPHKYRRQTIAQVVASLMDLDRIEEAWSTATDWLTGSAHTGDHRLPGSLMQDLGAWNFARSLHELSYWKNPTVKIAYLVGFASSRLFDWKAAATWYRAALPGNVDQAKTRYYLGVALERQGLWKEAAREYLRAAGSKKPSDYRIYRAVSCLASANDVEAGFEVLRNLDWNDTIMDGPLDTEAIIPLTDHSSLKSLLNEAVLSQRTTAIEYVAQEAVRIQQWKLAIAASSAIVERSWEHKPTHCFLLARAHTHGGMPAAALKAFLESRVYRDASVVDPRSYEKSRLVRNSMRYGSYRTHWEINPEAILYESNHGSKLTCNVLPLVRAMVDDSRFSHCLHYVVLPNRRALPEELRNRDNIVVVPRESDLYLRQLATAGIVINNNTFPTYYIRRRDQKYLNTWHGTPIKSMGRDIKNGNFDYRNASRNILQATHLALPNAHTREQLLDCYEVSNLYSGHIALTGSPRLDATLNLDSGQREAIRRRLGVAQDDNVILYAPTWRGELGNVVSIDEVVTQVLDQIETAGYRALYRGHPVGDLSGHASSSNVPTVPDDIDSNVLLACVDAVVSDYSSIAFDAALAGVPVCLFVYDELNYIEDRGLSLELRELGMPLAGDINEFAAWLEHLEDAKRSELNQMYSRYEDGQATARVLEFMTNSAADTLNVANGANVLLFEGHFIPNGITSAAKELNAVLKDSGMAVNVAVEPGAITPHPDRVQSFRDSTSGCRVLPRIAGAVDTAEQRWLIARQHQGQFLTSEQLACVHQAYEVEFNRLYGASKFEVAVGFEGFSLYWENLMAASTANRKVGYLHANMTLEAEYRFPYLWQVFETYQYFDVLACVSPDAYQVNARSLCQFAGVDQFVVAENLIDIESIRALSRFQPDREFLEFSRRFAYNFVAVGRVSIEKGSDRLIEAFLEVARDNRDVGLVVIGDGPLRLQLERRIHLAGLDDRVFFAGQLNSPFSYMRHCDSLLMSSHHEGQGIVVLEAFVLGLNVISVDIPGPRSLLGRGAGLLVENSTHGLVMGMRDALDGYVPEAEFDVDEYCRVARLNAVQAITGVDGNA